MASNTTPADILHFWFEEATPSQRFKKDPEFDHLIQIRFSDTLEKAKANELYSWRHTIEGRLAEIIVLDQFSRNLYRDSEKAFLQDAQALALAQEALNHSDLKKLSVQQKAFIYMPFMHSESLMIHEQAVRLFSEPGLEENLRFEILHKEIIEQFGRYPHRNEVLKRTSTPEELEYLRTTKIKF